MNVRILTVMESLWPLGPAAGWLRAAPALRRAGMDLHVALTRPCSLPVPADLPAEIHAACRCRGDREWPLRLRNLASSLHPDTIHCLESRVLTRVALSGIPARRAESFVDRATARAELGSRLARPDQIMVAQWPGDPEFGDALFVGDRATPVFGYQPGWPADCLPAGPLSPAARSECRLALQAQHSIPEPAVLVGTTARLVADSPVRNLIWAIDLLACIRDDVHLIVFGAGGQRRQLERFSRLTAAADKVHFAGEPADALDTMRAMDLVWTTGDDEASLLASGLAMSSGIPVVAIARPRLGGLLKHLQTALLVAPDSRDGFARWTKFLLEQDAARAKLVEQAGRWSREKTKPSDLPEVLARLYRGTNSPA